VAKNKKSRVPTPPRQVQAPGRRHEPRGPRDPRTTRILIAGLAGAVVVAVVIVVVVLVAGGGGGGGDNEELYAAAGCVATDSPSQGRSHVLELKESFKYSTDPPTSGPHHPEPAIWNVYDRPVEQRRLVHNLEHGGVVVQYGSNVPQAAVDEIIAWYRADPNGIIVAPFPELESAIALTAWTHLLTCSSGFNEAAFSAFRDDYRFKGPEAVPPEALAPGRQ
jgi:hypothetical protein